MSGSKQYSPQTGEYKVKVKEGADWKNFNACRLQISVGQPNHEGAKFKSTVQWVDDRFSKVIVCVNDILQKYTISFEKGVDLDLAEKLSKSYGDAWLKRNADIIQSAEISRWSEWLKHPLFYERRMLFSTLYKNNRLFRGAIDDNIDVFWSRRSRQNSNLYHHSRYEQFVELSSQYLIEEMAVFSLMGQKLEAVDIYPGAILIPLKVAQQCEYFGLTKHEFLTNFTRIDFARNF